MAFVWTNIGAITYYNKVGRATRAQHFEGNALWMCIQKASKMKVKKLLTNFIFSRVRFPCWSHKIISNMSKRVLLGHRYE